MEDEEEPGIDANEIHEWFNQTTAPIDLDQFGRQAAFIDCWGIFDPGRDDLRSWKAWVLSLVSRCTGPRVRSRPAMWCTILKAALSDPPDLSEPPAAPVNTRADRRDASEVLREQRENAASCPCGPPLELGALAYRRAKHLGVEAGRQAVLDLYADWEAQGHPPSAEYTPPWERDKVAQ